MLIGLIAQGWLKSAVANGQKYTTRLSGAEAARRMLDSNGLQHVSINQIGGFLSDHYDPRTKSLNLSQDIYSGRNAAAVGVACHEAGHAVQDATRYAPLVIRNGAVPMANIGSNAGLIMLIAGLSINWTGLAWLGLIVFGFVVFFQIINLPVEFNASSRGKAFLNESNIVDRQGAALVRSALYAAATTYVAATMQAVGTMLYYAMILLAHSSGSNRES